MVSDGRVALCGWVIFCRLSWSSGDGLGYRLYVSNGSAAAALMLTVAILTGMAHVHGSPARRHAAARHWSNPDRTERAQRPERAERPERADRVELGDANIPVRTVHRRHPVRQQSRNLYLGRPRKPERPPEVIVGYVNPARGSTAFHRLTNVAEGDRVKVVRRDHSVDWFKVDSVRRAVRRSIAEEHSSSGRPELRLISWRGARSPRNVVVSAHLDRPGQVDE